MKVFTILFCMMLTAFASINVQAQIKIPKTDKEVTTTLDSSKDALSNKLVDAINPGEDLGISADKLLKLTDNNKSYVGSLTDIFNGSESDEKKEALALTEQKERKSFVTNLLGKNKAVEYYTLIKPKVEPLITKYAIAKFLK